MIPGTVGEAVKAVSGNLKSAGIDGSRLDARLIVAHAAEVTPETILIHPERELDAERRGEIANLMARRLAREPMSHILGVREFWSMTFEVSSDTLTPRPDSECLVESVLAEVRDGSFTDTLSILDLGTGTGCILLALLRELPHAKGVGVDISADALAVAQRNADCHGLSERVEFRAGNWFAQMQGKFDVIVSNPPYIGTDEIALLEPEVAIHEPAVALDGGSDGLSAYRQICADAKGFLQPGGLLALEVGESQSAAVTTILKNRGGAGVRMKQDLAGRHRVVMATYLEK